MRTTNLNLMMRKGSRVVQMIIAHKSFHIIYIFKKMRSKNKVALAVELSIQYFFFEHYGSAGAYNFSEKNYADKQSSSLIILLGLVLRIVSEIGKINNCFNNLHESI